MKIALFAGTYEGRNLTDYLANSDCLVDVFTATLYGKELLTEYDNINIHAGRLDENEIYETLKNNDYDLILDATHPYADIVTKNIKNASEKLKIKYLRIIRDLSYDGKIYNDIDSLIDYLNTTTGNIMLTTGSKDLKHFTKIKDYKSRVYVRVLPMIASLEECEKNEYETSHILALQGPFSKEVNISLINEYNIKYLVTKLSGSSGGFYEKLLATIETNTELVVLGKEDLQFNNQGLTLDEIKEYLHKIIKIRKEINIIGCGMGNINNLTIENNKLIEDSELLIGSTRLLNNYPDKKTIVEINKDKIKDIIDNTPYKKIAILISGDVGYYSLSKTLTNYLKDYNINSYPGISSYVYFCSKIKISYENMVFLSLHGRNNNLINHVFTNEKVFTLLGNDNKVIDILNKLKEYKLDNLYIYIGENLSYPNERITHGYLNDILALNLEYDNLSVMVIINKDYQRRITYGYSDDNFHKDKFPMTKEEIRSLSISKLQLDTDSIVYDIGAGTGSVGIEIARIIPNGVVYSIEKEEDAVKDIYTNKIKFGVDNLNIICGFAPDVLKDLPTPTHAFIGGSSGNISGIIKVLINKNENIRIVINTITLETLSEVVKIVKDLNLNMEVVNINYSRNKNLANYNLMTSQNPIYIFTIHK